MSSFSGILDFRAGAPVSQRLLGEMSVKMSERGPDGGRELIADFIGISYRAFHTTRESRFEIQPLLSRYGHILAWNGVLHNRTELIGRLGRNVRNDGPEVNDALIVMTAYLEWGCNCFSSLIGDFSLALWDPLEKMLFLARDIAGVRPLFYHANRCRLIFSTEIVTLLDSTEAELEIEDEYVAGYLSISSDPSFTPYKGIMAVRPACVLTVSLDGQLSEKRFWGLDAHKRIHYKTNREYDEHFLSIFAEAIRERLRSDCLVLAELSGGLDSSSIVCMADRLIADGSVSIPGFETLSFLFDESATCDERKFIRAVEQSRHRAGHYLKDSDYPISLIINDHSRIFTHPECCIQGHRQGLTKLLLDTGARTVLSGKGGDEVMGGATHYQFVLADYIVHCRPLQLHRQLQMWSQILKQPYIRLLLMASVQGILPRQRGRLEVPTWYNKQFVKRMNMDERMLGPADIFGFRMPSDQDQAMGFLSAVMTVAAESQRNTAPVDYTYPYLHRPLVEFMQAIPSDQKVLPELSRPLMRRAMQGILTATIVKRKGKGIGNESFYRSLVRQWPQVQSMFQHPSSGLCKYIDPEEILIALNRARHGLEQRIGDVMKVIMLESWIRSLERRKVSYNLSTDVTGQRARRFTPVKTGAAL